MLGADLKIGSYTAGTRRAEAQRLHKTLTEETTRLLVCDLHEGAY
jgi:hypothetical protein